MAEGVLAQHRRRMQEDEDYRKAALSIDPDGAGGATTGKSLPTDEPTSLSAHQSGNPDKYDELTGDDLEQAVRDADIPGRSEMTADEKRQALRDRGA